MSYTIFKLDLENETLLSLALPLIQQLRTHLNFEKFRDLALQMSRENYELWAYSVNKKIMGLVSTRKYTDLVRGTHIYIDDLVTDKDSRSQGIGKVLLSHVEALAQKEGLSVLRLSCVIENEGGMKFYRREGWKERAFALVKKVI